MAKLIDGKLISGEVLDSVRGRVEYLKSCGVEPCLAVIIVGDDPASRVYVNNKKKSCEKVGIKSLEFALPADTKQEELIALIDRLNADSSVSGILCQLPVPEHIDSEELIRRISPEKDVDCFHPQNVGAVVTGGNVFLPCTPAGIIEMLHHENIATAGKNCVIVGRSNIVGKPMAMLMLHRHRLPFKDGKSRLVYLERGYSYRGGRQGEDDNRGYGEARRGGHRCRHEQRRKRQALRRCGL